jgi:hypothetical protein
VLLIAAYDIMDAKAKRRGIKGMIAKLQSEAQL